MVNPSKAMASSGAGQKISLRDIDANSEARYRDRVASRLARQEQRMARREETLDRLRQQKPDYKIKLMPWKKPRPKRRGKTPSSSKPPNALGALNGLWSDGQKLP